MKWLMNLWYARLRKLDLQLLWPECLKQAGSLTKAKAAFASHAYNDPAWLWLGDKALYMAIEDLEDDDDL